MCNTNTNSNSTNTVILILVIQIHSDLHTQPRSFLPSFSRNAGINTIVNRLEALAVAE